MTVLLVAGGRYGAVSTTEGWRINGRLYPDMIGPVSQAFGAPTSTVSV